MSRCFPFPAPGYESNHLELLAKEKHKEKKEHKKKRDKEKREGKERKDKVKSKDKHKEKKDRKEKHKDRKGKDKDRDKSRASDDRRNGKQSEVVNEEKLGDSSGKADDFRFTEEFGRRIRDGEEGAADRMLDETTGDIQKRLDNLGLPTIVDPVIKRAGNVGVTKMEKESTVGNKMVPEYSPPIQKKSLENQFIPRGDSEEHRSAAGNWLFPNFINLEQKRNEGFARVLVADRRTTANEMASKPKVTEQQRNDGLALHLEKIDKRMDGKVIKDRDTINDKRDKHKEKDHEKWDKGKDKEKHKEKGKKEKTKEKGEHKHKEHSKGPDSGRKPQVDGVNFKSLAPPKDNGMSDTIQENNRKRNHFQVNGFLPETDEQPNKLPKTASSSHLPLENGRMLQPCHLAALQYPAMEGAKDALAEIIQEDKEHKINGTTDVQAGLRLRPSPAAETEVPSSNPPHPDCKFLKQLYTVPKMEEWCEFDNQEWLFHNKHLQPMPSPELKPDEKSQVWAKAIHLDPVDVLALPYVIPY